jgi:hypothetical protein
VAITGDPKGVPQTASEKNRAVGDVEVTPMVVFDATFSATPALLRASIMISGEQVLKSIVWGAVTNASCGGRVATVIGLDGVEKKETLSS